MQIVKCPYCSRKLKLSHPVANAKLQCRYCMKLFVGTSYSDEQPLVKQPAQQQSAPADEFGELTDLVDANEPPGRPGTMPIPARHAPSSSPVHGHAPARPAGSPPRPAAGHAPRPSTGHAPKPAGQQRPQAAKPVAKPQAPADDPFAAMGGQDSGGDYGLSGEQEQQQQEQQAQSDDPFAALVGASSAPAAKSAAGRPRAAAGHQQAHGQERPTVVKPKKSPVAIIVIACVAVLAIAGIIVAVVMNSGEEKKPDDKAANTTAQAAQTPGAKADAGKETPKAAAPAKEGQAAASTEGQAPSPENQAGQTAAAGQTPAPAGEQKTSPEDVIKENLKVSYKFLPTDESDKSEGTFYGNLTNDNDMAFENVKITPIAVNGESQNPLPEVAITVRYVPPKSTIKFAAESNRLGYAKSEFDAAKYSVTYVPLPANQIIITSVKCDTPITTEDGNRLKTTGRATNSTAMTLTNIKIYIEYFTLDGMKTGGTFDGVELKGGTKSLTPGASESFAFEYDPSKKTSELPDMIKVAFARMIATKPN